MENVDASHEQAARVLGAGRVRIFATITIPLVLPAVLSGIVFVVLDSLSSFGAPAALGMMGNFSVLTVQIYLLLTHPLS